ncbi:MAG TPA: LTA synthase family protein [Thermoanaerobaculia bacterium]|nr:LTA synthase family protein [Thermoanaerobaculia bacterium]
MRRLPLTVFFVNLVILTLLRVAFFLAFRGTAGPLDGGEVVRAFYLGLKFDARLLAIVAFPLLFLRRFETAYVILAEVFLLALYAADFGTYAYIHQRLNAGVLEFLRNPLISMHMIWESYHVVLFALTIVALVAAIAFATARTVKRRTRQAGVSWLMAIFFVACMYGKVSRYPLRWSDAYFSRNPFIGALALNPAQYLFETTREKPAAYDLHRVRGLYPIMSAYLGVDRPDLQRLNFRRTPPLHPRTTGTPNVVIIQLESFAAFKTGAFGNPANGSPHFDAIAREGWLFTRHYSPSEKTARALFAVMFGIPDVSPWQASAHNPLTVDQASIANAFTGYDKLYFLGGSANWSNIRGMLAHNLDGLRIFEEGSYDAPVVDVWGISDEDLVLAANDVLRHETKPFFALIHTSGNHRPYDIPEKTHGFQLLKVDSGALRANGFDSNEEYNAFRYLDHAIGLFFDAARREPYFNNTVFVLYGDHGTRTGAPGTELTLGDLSPVVYHVPMLIYAPGFIHEGRRIDTPSSHVDILPTLASFCGRPYVNQALGLDLLDPVAGPRSAAFVFTTFHDPPDIELFEHSGTTIVKSNDDHPNLGRAFYETARWLLYHNR